MHGVSEVIAIILILMITISLAGLAYMFMSTTMSDVTASAGSTVDTTTSSMLTSFTIESIDVAKVYVRNTGQNALTSINVYVNDEPATYNVTTPIAAGAVGTVTIYSFIPDGATVKVTSPSGFSASKVAQPCEKAVGCWKFDEEDREVNPIVIADDNQASFWSSSPEVARSDESNLPHEGANCLKAVYTNATAWRSISHTFTPTLDLSAFSRLRFKMYGANSGKRFWITLNSALGRFTYSFLDNFTGWKQFSIPFSSFSIENSPNITDIAIITIQNWESITSGTWYFDRFVVDVCVPAEDSSGNGNTGIPVNGPTITEGRFGNALEFDGVNDYANVSHPNINWNNSNWTVSAYINLKEGVASLKGIFGNRFGSNAANWFTLGTLSSGNLAVEMGGGGLQYIDSGRNLAGSGWNLVTVTKTNSNLSLYINGVLNSSIIMSVGVNLGNSNNNVLIGRWYQTNQIWNGTIDEVRIYDRVIY